MQGFGSGRGAGVERYLQPVRLLQQAERQPQLLAAQALGGVLVQQQPARFPRHGHHHVLARAPAVVRERHALHQRGEHGVRVDLPPSLVLGDQRCQLHVGHHVARHEHEVGCDHVHRLDLAEGIARREARPVCDQHLEPHGAEPTLEAALVDVPLDLLLVRAAEDEDLVHAAGRQELACVLEHGHVHQRHEHLGLLEGNRTEVVGERVRQHDRLHLGLLPEVAIHRLGHCAPCATRELCLSWSPARATIRPGAGREREPEREG